MRAFNSARSFGIFLLVMVGSSYGNAGPVRCALSNNYAQNTSKANPTSANLMGYTLVCPDNATNSTIGNRCFPTSVWTANDLQNYCTNPLNDSASTSPGDSSSTTWFGCQNSGRWTPGNVAHDQLNTGACDQGANANNGGPGGANQPTYAPQETIDECMNARNEVQSGGGGCAAESNTQMVNQANMIKAFLSMASAAQNPIVACSQLKDLTGATSIAIGGFQVSCQTTVGACIDKCTAQPNVTSDSTMNSNLAYCEKMNAALTNSLPGMVANVTSLTATQTANCNGLANSLTTCTGNPTAFGCPGYNAADCTNPANVGTPACANSNANSNLSPTGSPVAALPGGGAAGAVAGMGGPGNGFANDSLGALLDDPTKIDPSKNNSGGSPGRGAGTSAGGMGGHGSDALPLAKAKGGVARDTKVGSLNGGLLSNNNGGFGGTKANGGYGDGKTGASGRPLFGAQYAVGQKVPNLNQFLPYGKYNPSRSIAGTTGPDGITGPDSNLFEKVKNQYSQQLAKGALLIQ